ncbi:MAG: hypothetical protein HFG34_05845 [Eubacterium sp.]|nr:hypothetical protein [Eubacterium sp.]
MNWVKFMKTDFLFYKYQKVVMMVFPVFVILMSIYSKDMIFIISYLCFGVLIVSTTPYCLENRNMSTFIQMLPGSDRERVVGRYMCFGAMLLAAVAYGIGVVTAVSWIKGFPVTEYNIYFSSVAVALSLIVGSVQFLVLYIAGRGKSTQWMNIMRMIPGFIFFFLINYIGEKGKEGQVESSIFGLADFFVQNKFICLISMAVAALLVFAGCILVSVKVVQNRDVI